MNLVLNRDDSRPAYVQIAHELRERIKQGAIEVGAKFPSVKKIAAEFHVSDVTTHKASKILEAEGLVIRRPGTGFVVRAESNSDTEGIVVLTQKIGSVKEQIRNISENLEALKKLSFDLEIAIAELQRKQ